MSKRVEDAQLVKEQGDERTQGALCKCVTETHSRWRFTSPAGSRLDAQRQSEGGGEGTAIGRRHLKPSSHYKTFSVVGWPCRSCCTTSCSVWFTLHDWAATGGSRNTRFWPGGEVTQEMIQHAWDANNNSCRSHRSESVFPVAACHGYLNVEETLAIQTDAWQDWIQAAAVQLALSLADAHLRMHSGHLACYISRKRSWGHIGKPLFSHTDPAATRQLSHCRFAWDLSGEFIKLTVTWEN